MRLVALVTNALLAMWLAATRSTMQSRSCTGVMSLALFRTFVSVSSIPFRKSASNNSGSIKHIVMFDFTDHTTAEDIARVKESLLNLPHQIPTIRSYELGQDLLLPSGQSHPAGRNRRIAWSCTFPDVQSFESYQSHPAHQEFLALLKPLVRPGSRAAIQYNTTTS